MDKTFHITTFGCQMNEHDSEILAGLLEERGYREVNDRKDAKVVVINTCSVRENADKRFFGTLGQLKKRKMAEPDLRVCICGCMMQQERITDKIKQAYPWVDIVFGTHNIYEFPRILERSLEGEKKIREIWEEGKEVPENLPCKRAFKSKALVNIMYGCNNFCTYCIVPYTRGRERSRKPEHIINEVTRLAEDGVKEVMLLGQNVNSYKGYDGTDFAALIYKINDIEGIERIRFMTSHPKDLSDRLIQAYVDCPKLCKNIHLPLQSGSTEILKKMNRHYTAEQYYETVEKLKKAVPGITLSTDIIVGFPGETEEDFEKTLEMVRKVRYDSAFTFIYSIREGTPAARWENQIPEEIKHERFDRLVKEIDAISLEKNKEYQGRKEKVLVEGPSKRNSKNFSGRTDGFKLVNFPADSDLTGEIVDVEITQCKTFSLEGKILNE